MTRAVFFDVGGTLIHPWPSVGAVYSRVGEQFGLQASAAAMQQAFQQAWKESKRGPLTTSDKDWWRALVARALAKLDLASSDEYFAAVFEAFAQPEAWQVHPEAIETLNAARARGLHVGVISNWDARLRPLLDRLELAQYFDSLTVSCEVGAEKPAAAIFLTALKAADVAASEAWHIGDSEEEDVRGAYAVGMPATLVTDRCGLRQALETVAR